MSHCEVSVLPQVNAQWKKLSVIESTDLMEVESPYEPIIPGLPDDLALRCLAKLSHGYHGLLETVSKRWRNLLHSPDYASFKAKEGWCGDWLFLLTESSKDRWIAYDPKADRWHPIPLIPRNREYTWTTGSSCVCVSNRFLVIGGAYGRTDPRMTHECSFTTDEVFQFDPFRKEWSKVASMRTPRSFFACCVMSGKVYVFGGRNRSSPNGIALAEVYDPLTDKWEELPPLFNPQADCLGLSYNNKLYVLNDRVGLGLLNENNNLDQTMTEIFDPSKNSWEIKQESWPFSRGRQVAVQVGDNGRLYTVVDWGESLIKSRDEQKGEWFVVAKVPFVCLPDHSRPLEGFDYGFAALGNELYVLGGKVLRWDETGPGRFDIVKLDRARVWDTVGKPPKWRETRPMCWPSCGSIIGFASLKER